MPLLGPKSVRMARNPETKLERDSNVSLALLTDLTRNEDSCDLEFLCGDGDTIACHQIVLASASNYLNNIIQSNSVKTGDDCLRSEKLMISIPEVNSSAMRGLLSVLYNGFTEFPLSSNSSVAKQIKAAFKVLRIDIVVLKDRNQVNVVRLSELSNTPQYQNRKSFKTQEILKEKVDSKTQDLISSLDKALEIEELPSLLNTPQRTSKDTPGGQREEIKSVTPLTTPTTASNSSRKRKISPTVKSVNSDRQAPQSAKKRKVEVQGSVAYSVEEIHTCVICNGRTEDGKVDKEASNLSFGELKKLKEHYSKHFYNEGKVFQAFTPDDKNLDSEGKIVDQFGKQYRYRCRTEGCWKTKKPACGYKEVSLHEAAEHGLFEKIASEDERPEVRKLMERIKRTN